MFNDSSSKTNGEQQFFKYISDKINIIFDVGCYQDSEYIDFKGTVHYFDPVPQNIEELKKKETKNVHSYYNNFGLGNANKELYYYPRYGSFFDRIYSCKISDDKNKILLHIKKAKDYIIEKNIKTIDFVKIDTEGFELDVLQGFEELLVNVKIIQFEYGGTFIDNKIKLIDVIKYLEEKGFHKFSYLTRTKPIPILNFDDHYQYCNIVCINKNSDFIPF